MQSLPEIIIYFKNTTASPWRLNGGPLIKQKTNGHY